MRCTIGHLTAVSVVTLLFTACPSAAPHADDEACEHLAEGPATSVTAVASGEGPLIADDHRRYDVALVEVTGGQGGRVRFAADEAGEYILFTDRAVPVALTDGAGAAVEPEATAGSSEACTEIAGRYVFDLEVGTYHLDLGPTAETSVGLLLEHVAHAH